MRKLLWIAPVLVLASMSIPGLGRAAEEITFFKVLDSDTAIPGGEGSFGAIHGLNEGSPPGRRLYYAEPHIAMDAEENLAFGAGDRMFAIIGGQPHIVTQLEGDTGRVSIDEGRVTFGVIDRGERVGGIFRWEPGGPLVEIAGVHTPVPDGGVGCVFSADEEDGISDFPFLADGDAILFSGRGDTDSGSPCPGGNFLWRNASIERVGDLPPQINRPSIDAGLIAFVGRDGAIYVQELGQAKTMLVRPGDRIPGRSAVFDVLRGPQVVSRRVAFEGRDTTGRWGAYLWQNETLSVLVEEGMQLPGARSLDVLSTRSGSVRSALRLGVDRFAVIGSDDQGAFLYLASLDGVWERVIDQSDGPFISTDSTGEFNGRQLLVEGSGVYVVRADGSVAAVLREGDVLDGQRVRRIQAGDLRGDKVTLGVEFEESNTDHLYIAELPPLRVEIDVKPRHTTNRVHTRSRRSIPVVVLGSETFGVEEVDAATLWLGPDSAPARGRPKLRDVNHDGWIDLVLRFRPSETGILAGDCEICLSGETRDRLKFEGCDSVGTADKRAKLSP